jgi:putative membrane protein, TIGR04086 family/integral membrane protein, TIGR04097 family
MKKVKAVVFSTIISVVIVFLLLLLASLIVSKTGLLSEAILPVVTTLLCCLAVFCGGCASALFTGERGILFGALTALAFLSILTMTSATLFLDTLGIGSIGKALSILFSGMIGGIMGANKKEKNWID